MIIAHGQVHNDIQCARIHLPVVKMAGKYSDGFASNLDLLVLFLLVANLHLEKIGYLNSVISHRYLTMIMF
ncbi:MULTISPECIES: hypothetical protein [Commensalibacter]|uniref:hypothetical protein n=1 Tax=Commensalibacter TaxID=1079922 RepID=UPI0012D9E7E8|nr:MULTISPECIES: hypothetical protein [Commensalibacter]MBI0180232.1 hypothetical protein [Commensalibacter sp. W8163]MUH07168.1 hypothetical protein [Commensalibacter melissae]